MHENKETSQKQILLPLGSSAAFHEIRGLTD